MVYKNDVRNNYPITNPMIAKMLVEKRFGEIYDFVLKDVFYQTELLNRNNISFLLKSALMLDFDNIEKKLRLIEKNIQLYIAYEMKANDEIIDGRQVWNEFKQLCLDKEKGYAQKKVELSRLAEKMSYFTYNVYNVDNKTFSCDEEFAGYCYIHNGERFIVDDKFDRKAFSAEYRGRFL